MKPSPSSNRMALLAVVGMFVLAVIGVGFLVLAVYLLVRTPSTAAVAPSPTVPAIAATQVVFVPTTTQSPLTDTPQPTVAPTATTPPAPAASATPAVSASPATSQTVKIVQPANVRSGPGTTYPIVAGLNPGDTPPVVGRDNSGQWFAISLAAAPGGTGWVSILVATYAGVINDLPVVQAAAPPPAATAVPPTQAPAPTSPPAGPTNTAVVAGANGIQTLDFHMEQTSGSTNQSLWFDFSVVNNTASVITYGILAAHTDQSVTADSWHQPLQPGKTLTWRDHINFPNSGTYQVYLGICYSSHDACKNGAAWTHLSNSTTVTIN